MRITLIPARIDEPLMLDREGDVLYINGEIFDFSPLEEGATLPRAAIKSDWFPGEAHRVNGKLHVSIRLPHGPNAPSSTRFPVPIEVLDDGTVELPLYDSPEEVVPDEQY